MAITKQCWYCIHFKPTLIGTNRGECHRYAPSGLSGAVVGFNGDPTEVFPAVYDATLEWCGDFQLNPAPVADPS